jgi:hypothetical protein
MFTITADSILAIWYHSSPTFNAKNDHISISKPLLIESVFAEAVL